VWSATVNYGDGEGAQPLPLVGKGFEVAHTYDTAGKFSLTVSISDDGNLLGAATGTVAVITPLAAVQGLAQQLQVLAESGALATLAADGGQNIRPLLASLDAAAKQIQRGNNIPAVNELGAFVNKINAEVISGRMSPDAAQPLTAMAMRIQRVLGG
jgi:hypothetical protein